MTKPVYPSTTPESLQREGLTQAIAAWEDSLRADTSRGSFEWWYFDAHFDDGSTAVIVYATKPLLERNGPLRPNVAITITRPDGTKAAALPLFPPEEFSASREGCDVHISPNRAHGDLHSYEIHTETDGLAADLTFTGLVPPWRPGAGKIYFGDDQHYFAWLPSIPFGTVEGTLTYDGEAHHVKGTGYHDHNWGNVGLNQVMDHWYWGRAHIGEYTLIFVEQVAARAYDYARLPVFMLAKGDHILVGDGEPLTLKTDDFVPHAGGRRYPRLVDFHWQKGGERIDLRLRNPRVIEATSLLLLLPPLQRRLARLFANPYYFRFNAQLELDINLKGLDARERGSALYEIMILQGRKHP